MLFTATTMFTLVLDQLSKFIVLQNMEQGQSIPIINQIFHLTYIQNPGAAFGLLAYRTTFFIFTTLAVVLGIIILYRRLGEKKGMLPLGMGLVVGGALGNLIDRLRYGKVVDFFDFRIWPVFNIADTAIVVGAGLLVLAMWNYEQKKSEKG